MVKVVRSSKYAFSSGGVYITQGYQDILPLKFHLKKLIKFTCFIVQLLLESYKINYKTFNFHHLLSGIFKDKMARNPQIIYYTKVTLIAATINLNHFSKLCSNLHVVRQFNPVLEKNDQFWKVKPFIEAVRKHYRELPLEKYNKTDDQMRPFKGRMPSKLFIKNKRNLVELTNFVICGKSGKTHDFEIISRERYNRCFLRI